MNSSNKTIARHHASRRKQLRAFQPKFQTAADVDNAGRPHSARHNKHATQLHTTPHDQKSITLSLLALKSTKLIANQLASPPPLASPNKG